jgi:hypothetical protein
VDSTTWLLTPRYGSLEHGPIVAPAAQGLPYASCDYSPDGATGYQNVVPSENWNAWVLSQGCWFRGKA